MDDEDEDGVGSTIFGFGVVLLEGLIFGLGLRGERLAGDRLRREGDDELDGDTGDG